MKNVNPAELHIYGITEVVPDLEGRKIVVRADTALQTDAPSSRSR